MYVKHRPFMNKKCEKTFELLRSEITFLMDLYITDILTLSSDCFK